MKRFLLAILLLGCTKGAEPAKAEYTRSQVKPAQSEPEREMRDVCVSVEETVITKVGPCDQTAQCGVILTYGVRTSYCTLKWPVEGAKVRICGRWEEKNLTDEEAQEYYDKIDGDRVRACWSQPLEAASE